MSKPRWEQCCVTFATPRNKIQHKTAIQVTMACVLRMSQNTLTRTHLTSSLSDLPALSTLSPHTKRRWLPVPARDIPAPDPNGFPPLGDTTSPFMSTTPATEYQAPSPARPIFSDVRQTGSSSSSAQHPTTPTASSTSRAIFSPPRPVLSETRRNGGSSSAQYPAIPTASRITGFESHIGISDDRKSLSRSSDDSHSSSSTRSSTQTLTRTFAPSGAPGPGPNSNQGCIARIYTYNPPLGERTSECTRERESVRLREREKS